MNAKPALLIVDDNAELLKILGLALRSEFEVELCQSPLQAAVRAEMKAFDLLVTDFRMPNLDGIDLIRKIRRHSLNPGIRQLLISAECLDEVIKQRGEAVICLQKPFSLSQLQQSIRDALSVELKDGDQSAVPGW